MKPASPSVHAVTSTTFEAEVLRSPVPVLVDFTATWCGPCKALAKVMDRLAEETDGRVRIVTLDIDDAPEIATRFGVRSVPTVVAFHRGEKTAQHVGLTTREKLLAMLPAQVAPALARSIVS